MKVTRLYAREREKTANRISRISSTICITRRSAAAASQRDDAGQPPVEGNGSACDW